jgi:hypothetical protein
MANLTTANYKAEMDAAFTNYESSNFYNIERGMAWAQIGSVYSHLYVHQLLFDSKAVTPSALALGYRTKAEGYLTKAKSWANQSTNSPAAVGAAQAASVAAFAYSQIVKVESSAV